MWYSKKFAVGLCLWSISNLHKEGMQTLKITHLATTHFAKLSGLERDLSFKYVRNRALTYPDMYVRVPLLRYCTAPTG